MSFAGCEAKLHRQAIGVHDCVNLARQPASRPAHVLFSVARDAGSMLVYTHDGGINHLHRAIVGGGQRFHDLVPDASLPPANEAIVAGRVWPITLWQVAPRRTRSLNHAYGHSSKTCRKRQRCSKTLSYRAINVLQRTTLECPSGHPANSATRLKPAFSYIPGAWKS